MTEDNQGKEAETTCFTPLLSLKTVTDSSLRPLEKKWCRLAHCPCNLGKLAAQWQLISLSILPILQRPVMLIIIFSWNVQYQWDRVHWEGLMVGF
jgi:hypothetical protein